MEIQTGLILRTVFGLALRQTKGLIGSIIHLLEIELAVPDHSTLGRPAQTVTSPKPTRRHAGPVQLSVDSTGLKLNGPGEWLVEKHETTKRRSWRKLHIGLDAVSGEIAASTLTGRDIDDTSQVAAQLDQVDGSFGVVMGDGAYDSADVTDDDAFNPISTVHHRLLKGLRAQPTFERRMRTQRREECVRGSGPNAYSR